MLPGTRGKKQRRNMDKPTALLIILYLLLLTFVGDLVASIIGVATGNVPYNEMYFAALRLVVFGGLNVWAIIAARKYSRNMIAKREALIAKGLRCPVCESETILRTMKKGPDTGKKFYVCENYPQCKGKVQVRE